MLKKTERWTNIDPMAPGGEIEISMVTSCYIKLVKRKRPDELLCSEATFTIVLIRSAFCERF